jgi:type IV secretion system protein VirB1
MMAGAALAVLLKTCASSVAPSTMNAIVGVESAGNPWALNDNATGRSYAPRSYAEALNTAKNLITQGHSVDVGIAQVNSGNFAGYHVTPAAMLMPCQNLIVASEILTNAYRWSYATYGEPHRALWGSISAYNTGSLTAGGRYVGLVVAAAQVVPSVDLITGGYAALGGPSPAPSGSPHPRPSPRVTASPKPFGTGQWHSQWPEPK